MARSLRGLRCDLGMTQEQLAKELDISVSAYQKYESYQHKIPADVLLKIADMCDIDPREIKLG